MWFDETPRLFSIADILQKRSNKNENYSERDDIPEIKEQPLTGKYNHNCDALGSDFAKAHYYDFKTDEKLLKNTEPIADISYFKNNKSSFDYEPCEYVRWLKSQQSPFTKSDEKANEYFIDNLQGKTIDDLVISKMKENAKATDLPRDAARRQFAEGLIQDESRDAANVVADVSSSDNLLVAPQSVQSSRRGRRDRTLGDSLSVHIDAPIIGSSSTLRAAGGGGGGTVRGGRGSGKKNHNDHQEKHFLEEQFEKTMAEQYGSAETEKDKDWTKIGRSKSRRQQGKSAEYKGLGEKEKPILSAGADFKLNDIDDDEPVSQPKTVQDAIEEKKTKGKEKLIQIIDNKEDKKEKNKKPSTIIKRSKTTDDIESEGKTLEELEARLAKLREEQVAISTEEQRKTDLRSFIPKLDNTSPQKKDLKLEQDDWIRYQALAKFYNVRVSRNTKVSTASKNLKKILENFSTIEDNIKMLNDENVDADDTDIAALQKRWSELKTTTAPIRTIPSKRITFKDNKGTVLDNFSPNTKSPSKLKTTIAVAGGGGSFFSPKGGKGTKPSPYAAIGGSLPQVKNTKQQKINLDQQHH